jgi:hypothetical protein
VLTSERRHFTVPGMPDHSERATGTFTPSNYDLVQWSAGGVPAPLTVR